MGLEARRGGYEVARSVPSPRRTALNRYASVNRNLRGKLWTLYMRLGVFLDGEEIEWVGRSALAADRLQPGAGERRG
jgi:hypothetical protein